MDEKRLREMAGLDEAIERPVVPTDIPGNVTANPKTITRDIQEIVTLARGPGARKEIELFVRDWNKERGAPQGKIVAQFVVGLMNRLAGGPSD
jgi:hypothetical protein